MGRPSITKTLGPIHFEDLDPRRFEDLVRELAYDFKDWQSIEATGRGGSDDGFDIRAYERVYPVSNESNESDEHNSDEDTAPSLEGHVWMFQCKREKQIGPARVEAIISDGVDPKAPPYGYVLAAPADFSKKSYDRFREELRKRGVMEFYLWGRAALEDMLHLPKNDHILFTFFGISLVSRRKSRATEIRAVVNTKNRLLKLFGETPHHKPVLLRDTKDVRYPYKDGYRDFNDHPRWREYVAVRMHPLGLIVETAKYFAFHDPVKKIWDYSHVLNLSNRDIGRQESAKKQDLRQNIEAFWEFIPRANQAMFVVEGLVRFDSIAVIDGEGDVVHRCPHVYVDFQAGRGPFAGFWEWLEIGERSRVPREGLKRAKKFPKTFSLPRIGVIYRDKTIVLNNRTHALFEARSAWMHSIYDCDDRYEFLNPSDVIGVEQSGGGGGKKDLIKITHKRKVLAADILECRKDNPMAGHDIEEQIGRPLESSDIITAYEFKIVHEWQLEARR
jgi:hypothetical protein